MYRLKTSDRDNSKLIARFEESPDMYKKLIKAFKDKDENAIKFHIYNTKINDEDYGIFSSLLTLADDFDVPIRRSMAEFLYFVLAVNHEHTVANFPFSINNADYGQFLFEQCKGNFRELDIKNLDDGKEHKEAFLGFTVSPDILFDDFSIEWGIPISHWVDNTTKEVKTLLAGKTWSTFAKFKFSNEPGVEYKIPRDIFFEFFRKTVGNDGRVMSAGHDAEESHANFRASYIPAFVKSSRAVIDTLNYIGYKCVKELETDSGIEYFYDQGLCARILTAGAQLEKDPEDLVFWKETSPGSGVFRYRGYRDYIPTRVLGGKIGIYIK